jgi:hypothetical protein
MTTRRDSRGSGEEGTDGNGIRHVGWQAMITKELGAGTAKRIGNAHENDSDVDLKQRNFDYLSDADQTIDLLNNIIGRKIGNENKESSNLDLMKDVLNEYHDNGLWKSNKTENGYEVIKSKLSDKQYNQAINELNKLDENGKRKK